MEKTELQLRDTLAQFPRAHQVLPDPLDCLDPTVNLESLELPVLPRRASTPSLLSLDQLDPQVHLDLRVPTDRPAMSSLDSPVPKDLLDPPVNLELMETRELPVQLEIRALMERRESVPSIAPSMEESSSRMVPEDVRQLNKSLKASNDCFLVTLSGQ